MLPVVEGNTIHPLQQPMIIVGLISTEVTVTAVVDPFHP